jgi:hypothetical protein
MKFGLYKTAIEKKLVNSFVSENLTKDMKQFKRLQQKKLARMAHA